MMTSRVRRSIFIGIGSVLACAILLLCTVPPKVATAPVRLTRDAGGQWHTADGQPWPLHPAVSLQLRKSDEHTGITSSSTIAFSGIKRFACAHIAILPKSDHLLLKRVAEGLITEWTNQPFAQEISYFPHGSSHGVGQQSPDLYITLELAKVHESGFPWSRRLAATVHAEVASNPGRANALYVDQYEPPTVQLWWSGDIDYQETQLALTSSSLRYQAEGTTIAKQLAKSLADECAKHLAKYGPLPALPAIFTPPYQPPPALPFLAKYHAMQILSTHGLLTATDAYWRISAPDTALSDLFTEIWREQTANGWQGARPQSGDNRMTLFHGDEARRLIIANQGQQTTAVDIEVVYQARMTDDVLAQAIDGLLADSKRVQDVLLFIDRLQPRQKRQVMALLQTHPRDTVRDCLILAELLQEQQKMREARLALQQAYIMQRMVSYDADQQQRIDDLAKKLQVKLRVTAPLLQQCGFHRQTEDGSFPKITFGVNEAAQYYIQTGKGLSTIAIGIKPVAGTTGESYQMHYVEYNADGASAFSAREEPGDLPVRIFGSYDPFSQWRFVVQRTSMQPLRFTVTPSHL